MSSNYANQEWYKNTIPQIKRHEGFSAVPYKDPSGKNYSQGYGFNINEPFVRKLFKKYNVGSEIDQATASKILNDIVTNISIPQLRKSIPNFDRLPDNAKGVVLNMMFQMGQLKFNGFEKMREALTKGDYKEARKEMLDSDWARNYKLRNRVNELAEQMYYTGKNLPGATAVTNNPYHKKTNYIPTATQVPAQQAQRSQQVPQVQRSAVQATPAQGATPKYHTVKPGDSYDKIRRQYNVPMNKLYRLNNISPKIKNPVIRPGQQVRVAQNQVANPQPMTVTASEKFTWSKLASNLTNKLAKMKKEIPVDNMQIQGIDVNQKPMAIRKDNVPINVKRLIGRIVKENNKASKKEASDKVKSVEDLFEAIYNEDKKYWPYGLNVGLYNGDKDIVKLIKDKDNNLAGFVATQVRETANDKPTAFYSVGILPEHRGKGLASKHLKELLKEQSGKDYKHFYTVHKDNIPSLSLYNNVISDYPNLTLKIFN